MARRAAYTKVEKRNFLRPQHVKMMSDKLWRGFQCLNPECTNNIVVRDDAVTDDFHITCDRCGFEHQAGEVLKICDYDLIDYHNNNIIESGPFELLHDDYVAEAARLKYCVICGALKPIERFDMHKARIGTGQQGECNLCKQVYNGIKNQTRIVDQHREASQKRRLYTQFGTGKIDFNAIYARFEGRCFKCGCDVAADLKAARSANGSNLDHTLPVYYLWPLTTNNATILCREHNGAKAEKWPSAFYNEAELRRLSRMTGIEYKVLAGAPFFNPAALAHLQNGAFVDGLFDKFARYPEELLRLRNRVLKATGDDFLTSSKTLSDAWRQRADALLRPAGKAGTGDG